MIATNGNRVRLGSDKDSYYLQFFLKVSDISRHSQTGGLSRPTCGSPMVGCLRLGQYTCACLAHRTKCTDPGERRIDRMMAAWRKRSRQSISTLAYFVPDRMLATHNTTPGKRPFTWRCQEQRGGQYVNQFTIHMNLVKYSSRAIIFTSGGITWIWLDIRASYKTPEKNRF